MLNDFAETAYVLQEDVRPSYLQIKDAEAHHLMRVRRKRIGDYFWAADGNGKIYECEVCQIEANCIQATIHNVKLEHGEPAFKLSLGIALFKKDRFRFVIEKGTELGVTQFQPMLTEYTTLERRSFRIDRNRKVAISAMKQCCRSRLPEIHEPEKFEQVIAASEYYDCKWIAHEKAEITPSLDFDQDSGKSAASGLILVGPEGGFSDREVERALENGFAQLGLGPRRLRAETAAIAAVSCVLNRLGELS